MEGREGVHLVKELCSPRFCWCLFLLLLLFFSSSISSSSSSSSFLLLLFLLHLLADFLHLYLQEERTSDV